MSGAGAAWKKKSGSGAGAAKKLSGSPALVYCILFINIYCMNVCICCMNTGDMIVLGNVYIYVYCLKLKTVIYGMIIMNEQIPAYCTIHTNTICIIKCMQMHQ